MSSFALDLSKFTKLTEKRATSAVKKVFIELSADIIRDTPVDSGRLRANWLPAINKYANFAVLDTDKAKTARKTIAKVTEEGLKYKLGDTLTLTNNLVYAKRIEFGYSKHKSPQGMVRINIKRFQKIVDKAVLGEIKRKAR